MKIALPIVIAVALLLAPGLALAQPSIVIETSKSATPNGKPAVALLVNGLLVVRLAKPDGGLSPERRISVVSARIAEAYREGRTELKIKADESGERFTVYMNGSALITATNDEGKAWGATPEQLANSWRDNLAAAIAKSPNAPPSAPPSGASPSGTAAPGAGSAAPAAGNPAAGSGVLSDPAYAALTISHGHHVYEPPDYDKLNSSKVESAITARICGTSISAADASRCVDNAVRVLTKLGESAQMSWQVTDPLDVNLALGVGQKKQLTVEYSVPGLPQPTGSVSLLLENRPIATPRESLTFFSNVPESIAAPQLLYTAALPAREAGRLVYHHQNSGRANLRFIARLLNQSSERVDVHVIPGGCVPDINTFLVGFKSAEAFWTNLNAGNGYVLHIPAGGQVYLAAQGLAAGLTASGYFKLTNLGDSALRLETLTLPAGGAPPEGPARDGGAESRGVFPAPFINVSQTYTTGGEWLYLRLGDDAPDAHDGSGQLDGQYGITHTFNVELRNPSDQPALVFVVLRASAGEVKGQFFIDDQYVATRLIAGGNEQLLTEIPLKPGETTLLKIKGMPLNGGFYPASIILRQSRMP